MSRGIGKTEQAVLAFIKANRRNADTGLNAPTPQRRLVEQMSSEYSGAAIRRAILSLARKGLLYKLTERYAGVLVDIEPVTQWWHYSGKHLEPASPRRKLPDLEPLILAALRGHVYSPAGLAQKIIPALGGCSYEIKKSGRPTGRHNIDYAAEAAYRRTVERLVKEGKIRKYRDARKPWRRRGDLWLSLVKEL